MGGTYSQEEATCIVGGAKLLKGGSMFKWGIHLHMRTHRSSLGWPRWVGEPQVLEGPIGCWWDPHIHVGRGHIYTWWAHRSNLGGQRWVGEPHVLKGGLSIEWGQLFTWGGHMKEATYFVGGHNCTWRAPCSQGGHIYTWRAHVFNIGGPRWVGGSTFLVENDDMFSKGLHVL